MADDALSRLLEFLPWVFPESHAKVDADGVDTGGKVLAHHAVAVVDAHDSGAHVETEVGSDAKRGVGVSIVIGYHGDFEPACADAEIGRDDHSVLIVGKGEGISCSKALEGEVALGERMIVVEIEVAIGDAGVEAEIVVGAFGIFHGDVRQRDVGAHTDGEGRLLA